VHFAVYLVYQICSEIFSSHNAWKLGHCRVNSIFPKYMWQFLLHRSVMSRTTTNRCPPLLRWNEKLVFHKRFCTVQGHSWAYHNKCGQEESVCYYFACVTCFASYAVTRVLYGFYTWLVTVVECCTWYSMGFMIHNYWQGSKNLTRHVFWFFIWVSSAGCYSDQINM